MTLEQFYTYQEQTFDSFCKAVIRNESIDAFRELAHRREHEIEFSALSPKEIASLRAADSFDMYRKSFRVHGYIVEVCDRSLGEILDYIIKAIEQDLKPYESNVKLYPVVYERAQQNFLIRDFILKTLEHFETGDEDILRYMASNQLLQWSLVFKSDYFKHEEEFRLIVDVGIKKYESQKDIPQIPIYLRPGGEQSLYHINRPIFR